MESCHGSEAPLAGEQVVGQCWHEKHSSTRENKFVHSVWTLQKNSKALKGRLAPRSSRKEQCSILFGQFSKSRIRFPTTTKSLMLVGQLQQEYRDKKIK